MNRDSDPTRAERRMKREAGLTGRQKVRRMKPKSIWERARLVIMLRTEHTRKAENARRERQIAAGTRRVSAPYEAISKVSRRKA